MPNYQRYENGVVVESVTLTPEQEAAEADAEKTLRVDAADIVALRGLFYVVNNHRAMVRAFRSMGAAANAAADAQGVEPARPDLTFEQFKTIALKALL